MGKNRLDPCGWRVGGRGCSNKGRYEWNGKWLCKVHHPPTQDNRYSIEWTKQKVLALTARFHTTMESGTLALWMMSEGPDEMFKAVEELKRLGWEPEEVNSGS